MQCIANNCERQIEDGLEPICDIHLALAIRFKTSFPPQFIGNVLDFVRDDFLNRVVIDVVNTNIEPSTEIVKI